MAKSASPDQIFRKRVRREVAGRGLTSFMNDAKWRELQSIVRLELPFCPPYQLKMLAWTRPHPETFDEDVWYLGDWSDECLQPFAGIEWMRVRPRYTVARRRPADTGIEDCSEAFEALLARFQIPARADRGSYWIYGYAAGNPF